MSDQLDTRNVIDYFKGMADEEILADLDSRRTPLVNICMNLSSDFNKSSVIRANNAFLGRKVVFVGGYDGRPYIHVESSNSLASIVHDLRAEGYTIWAVDNIEDLDPVSIFDQKLPSKSAFVYGSEQNGLRAEEIEFCDGIVFIPMPGIARSLNIAQAASIVMAEYSRQQVTS